MVAKKFQVTLTAEVEIDEAVLKTALEDSWQSYIGKMTEKGVAQYIAFNLLHNRCELTSIDGFADRKDSEARIVPRTIEVEVEAL